MRIKVKTIGNIICLPIMAAFITAVIFGNTFELEKVKMRKGTWSCPKNTDVYLANTNDYIHKSMPTFSQISGTSNTFCAAIWRMIIGAVSGLRIFVLPFVYYKEFVGFKRKLIVFSTVGEAVGIMGLTFTFTMSPNNLMEEISKFDSDWRSLFDEFSMFNELIHVFFFVVYMFSVMASMFCFAMKYERLKTTAGVWGIVVFLYVSSWIYRKNFCLWYIWSASICFQYTMIFLTIYFTRKLLVDILGENLLTLELNSKNE